MSEFRKFPKEFLEDVDFIDTVRRDYWRHGTRDKMIFEHDGAHWSVIIDNHHEEGLQFWDATAVKVHKVKKLVDVWEAV